MFERRYIFQTIIFGIYVSFGGNFKYFFGFHPENWGNDDFWLIFFQKGWTPTSSYLKGLPMVYRVYPPWKWTNSSPEKGLPTTIFQETCYLWGGSSLKMTTLDMKESE